MPDVSVLRCLFSGRLLTEGALKTVCIKHAQPVRYLVAMHKKYFIVITILVLVVVIIGVIFYRTHISKGHTLMPPIHTNVSDTYARFVNQGIHFEIATTTTELERGLSGRKVIPNNYAMLFVFQQAGRYGFWMKNMLTPIDILWLSDNGTIIGIDNSVQPNTYPHIFYPPVSVRYVLETRPGFSAGRSWRVGSVIALPLPYGKNFSK